MITARLKAWHDRAMLRYTFALLASSLATPVVAQAPVVVAADATQTGTGWTITVTLSHPDRGWDHFASGWAVLAPDGTRLGYRELTHPHVDEQPFTRSLSGLAIPAGVTYVLIRPRCTLDGWVAEPTRLDLAY